MEDKRILENLNCLGIYKIEQFKDGDTTFWFIKKYQENSNNIDELQKITNAKDELNNISFKNFERVLSSTSLKKKDIKNKKKVLNKNNKKVLKKENNQKLTTFLDLYEEGVKLFNERKYEEAKVNFSLSIDSSEFKLQNAYYRSMSYYFRGFCLHKQSKYSGAIKDFTEAIERSQIVNPDFYYRRGLSKNGLSKYKDAIPDFEMATSINPNNTEYKELLRWSKQKSKSQSQNNRKKREDLKKENIQQEDIKKDDIKKKDIKKENNQKLNTFLDLYEEGVKLFNEEKYEEAKVNFQEFIDSPAFKLQNAYYRSMSYYFRGCCLSKVEKYGLANTDFTEAIKIFKDSSFYFQRGLSYTNLSKYEDAIKDFKNAISIKPYHPEYKNLLDFSLKKLESQNKNNKIEDLKKENIQKDDIKKDDITKKDIKKENMQKKETVKENEISSDWYQKGLILFDECAYEKAKGYFSSAIHSKESKYWSNKQRALAYNYLGLCYYYKNQYTLAINYLNIAIHYHKNPDYIRYLDLAKNKLNYKEIDSLKVKRSAYIEKKKSNDKSEKLSSAEKFFVIIFFAVCFFIFDYIILFLFGQFSFITYFLFMIFTVFSFAIIFND